MALRVIAPEGRYLPGIGNFRPGDVIDSLTPEQEQEFLEGQPWAFEKIEDAPARRKAEEEE